MRRLNPCLSAWINCLGTIRRSKKPDLSAAADWIGARASRAPTPRQRLESGLAHLVNLADTSVNDCADTANRTVKVDSHFTPERAEEPGLVEVLHHDDLWTLV